MANQGETANPGEAASPTDDLSESARSAYDSAREGSAAMRDTAAATAERYEEEAEEYLAEGQASFNEMVNKAEFAIIDHPLAAVGMAFAAGWITSKLFR